MDYVCLFCFVSTQKVNSFVVKGLPGVINQQLVSFVKFNIKLKAQKKLRREFFPLFDPTRDFVQTSSTARFSRRIVSLEFLCCRSIINRQRAKWRWRRNVYVERVIMLFRIHFFIAQFIITRKTRGARIFPT